MTHEEILKTIYSLDDFDYSFVESDKPEKICVLCGKSFKPTGRNRGRQRYCNRTHYLNCLVCGKPVKQDPPSDRIGLVKYTCSKECADKLKVQKAQDTMEEKYGARNPSQVTEFHNKAVESIKAKIPQTNEKIRATLESKYGGIGTSSPELRAKIEKTMLERYGVTNPDQSEQFRKKMSDIQKQPEVKQKHIETSQRIYGTDYPSQSEIVQIAMMKTLMRNHGVPYSGWIPGVHEKAKKTCEERYGVSCVLQRPDVVQKAKDAMVANKTGRVSAVNLDFIQRLNELGIPAEPELYIAGKWYDVDLHRSDLTMEIDPTYTHSDLPNHWENGKDPKYHLERTIFAAKNGYRCIHVFDWDDINKVVYLVSPKTKLYARNCEIKQLLPKEVCTFINENHLQGDVKNAKVAYGLFSADQLVQVMTFGPPRYNKNYQWELLRLCSHHDYSIIGGASKLFKTFLREQQPESVISYCDRAKFSGEVYYNIGMQLHHTTEPAKVWSKGTKKITDNLLRQRGFDQLFGTDYGKGTSNEMLMIENGWRSVYDCGQMVFEWKRPE